MLARVHSLLGVVPLAAYLCLHVYDNWPALQGREAWLDRALHVPGRAWIAPLVLLPMLVHALLGLRRMRTSSGGQSWRAAQWDTRLQAITGLLVVAFVALHVGQVWGVSDGAHSSPRAVYAMLWTSLGQPVLLAAYVLGVSAVCLHLGHGLPRAARTLAPALSQQAWLVLRIGGGLLGLLLWLMFLQLLAYFALGQALLPS